MSRQSRLRVGLEDDRRLSCLPSPSLPPPLPALRLPEQDRCRKIAKEAGGIRHRGCVRGHAETRLKRTTVGMLRRR
eukprot:9064775-Pyramimonas_sp.AAC.1